VYEMESGRARFFDLVRDPHEAHNLDAERSAARAEYTRRLTQWIKTATGG
jgi:hypothetical protein